MTETWWPSRSSSAFVRCSVRTTPLTCGAQASVTRAKCKGVAPLARHSEVQLAGHEHGELPPCGPFDDLQPAVAMLDQRGAALHPVAVIAIEDAVDLLDLGLVDVAADDAVQAASPGLCRH